MAKLFSALRGLNAYVKPGEELRSEQVRTLSGALFSTAAIVIVALLALSEVVAFFRTDLRSHVEIDNGSFDEIVPVDLNVAFFHIPCDHVDIVVQDSRGVHLSEVRADVTKKPFKATWSAPSDKEGCEISGVLHLDKVSGYLHIPASQLLGIGGSIVANNLDMDQMRKTNVTHEFRRFSWGAEYPNKPHVLDGAVAVDKHLGSQFQYFLQVVPTIYDPVHRRKISSYQFSVTEFVQELDRSPQQVMPGLLFKYDFSPVRITQKEEHRKFLELLVSLCSIIGGTVAVSGLLDALFYRTTTMLKKMD